VEGGKGRWEVEDPDSCPPHSPTCWHGYAMEDYQDYQLSSGRWRCGGPDIQHRVISLAVESVDSPRDWLSLALVHRDWGSVVEEKTFALARDFKICPQPECSHMFLNQADICVHCNSGLTAPLEVVSHLASVAANCYKSDHAVHCPHSSVPFLLAFSRSKVVSLSFVDYRQNIANERRREVQQAVDALQRHRTEAARLAMLRSWQHTSAEVRRAMAWNVDWYLENLQRMANDPLYVPTGHRGTLWREWQGWLTNVMEGMTISFLCRNRVCLFYGMNSHWVRAIDSEHFCCPKCGEGYRPWAAAPHLVNAQKCLSFVHPSTHVAMAFPVVWPSTAEDCVIHTDSGALGEPVIYIYIYIYIYMPRAHVYIFI